MDESVAYQVLTWVLRLVPAVVPVAVALLTIIIWLSVTGFIARRIAAAGHARHSLYANISLGQFGFIVAIVLANWVGEKLSGDPLERFLANIWLISDIGIGEVAGYSLLLCFAFFAIALLSGSVSAYFGEKATPFALALRPRTVSERFAWVMAVSPSAGFCEEVLYRGIFLWVVLDISHDPIIAVAITSFLFGLGHTPYGLTWTIGSSLFGVIAAISVLWCESLWPAIVAHTFYDMTVYYIFYDDTAGGELDDEMIVPARFARWMPPLR